MSQNSKAFEVRPSQLVSPFGPGAVVVDRHGITWIIQGVDHWYCSPGTDEHSEAESLANARAFSFAEPRLAAQLGVQGFRRPPEWREPEDVVAGAVTQLTIPAYSFPALWFCPNDECGRMTIQGIQAARQRPKCNGHDKTEKIEMKQVSFAVMCESGHLSDFPVVDWVHRESNSLCSLAHIRRKRGSKAGWSGIRFYCSNCKKSRGLDRVQVSTETGSVLQTNTYEAPNIFHCEGRQPWLGGSKPRVACAKPPVATYLGALNSYFADTQSAIFIPEEDSGEQLLLKIEQLSSFWKDKIDDVVLDYDSSEWARRIQARIGRNRTSQELEEIQFLIDAPELNLMRAIELRQNVGVQGSMLAGTSVSLKDREFQVLTQNPPSVMRPLQLPPPSPRLSSHGIESLLGFGWIQETRALTGFTRKVYPLQESGPGSEARSNLSLAPHLPWLPAIKNFGDGIFVKLDREKLLSWRDGEIGSGYFSQIDQALSDQPWKASRFSEAAEPMGSPVFLAVHSLAHVLIGQIALYAGYNAASLRERVYVSSQGCGFLLYSTDGDADGSLGGLLALAESGEIPDIIEQGLTRAEWCANNPICSERSAGHEVAITLGLGACHSCLYLPETSCEWSNRLLDRHVLVGTTQTGSPAEIAGLFSGQ